MIRPMPFNLSAILSITAAIFKERADLIAENMALRHQLSCLIHRGRQPKLHPVVCQKSAEPEHAQFQRLTRALDPQFRPISSDLIGLNSD